MEITEREEALMKESWELMKQDVSGNSLHMFTIIGKMAPETRYMFSFLKDYEGNPMENPKFRAHATKVFKLTCETAVQLGKNGQVTISDIYLNHLGQVHLQKQVTDHHFQVIREALLATVKDAVGERWTEDMDIAWGKAYDTLALAIKAKMKHESPS